MSWNSRAWSALARGRPSLEEASLQRVSGHGQRRLEVLARNRAPALAKLELAERGRIERVGGQPIRCADRVDFFDSTLLPLVLRHGNASMEGDHPGGANPNLR